MTEGYLSFRSLVSYNIASRYVFYFKGAIDILLLWNNEKNVFVCQCLSVTAKNLGQVR